MSAVDRTVPTREIVGSARAGPRLGSVEGGWPQTASWHVELGGRWAFGWPALRWAGQALSRLYGPIWRKKNIGVCVLVFDLFVQSSMAVHFPTKFTSTDFRRAHRDRVENSMHFTNGKNVIQVVLCMCV